MCISYRGQDISHFEEKNVYRRSILAFLPIQFTGSATKLVDSKAHFTVSHPIDADVLVYAEPSLPGSSLQLL
jgi:hypothetical protein